MEPFPPKTDEMNNDGLLHCYMNQVMDKYPHLVNFFDLVVDFGVFGWDEVQNSFDEQDVQKYVQSVTSLLKPNGMWALKVDKGWVTNQEQFMDKFILPYFDMGKFVEWESGHELKRKFQFYFFYIK